MRCLPRSHHRTRGSVLVFGLLMLLVISLITLATLAVPSVELKMARNASLQIQAFATAETHLTLGEERVQADFGGIPRFALDEGESDCLKTDIEDSAEREWCNVSSTAAPSGSVPSGYQIQFVGPASLEFGTGNQLTDRYYFTVHGAGREDTGQRQVQSVYMTTELAP